MKKIFAFFVLTSLLATSACSDDPDDKAPAETPLQVLQAMTDGTWHITTFSENGNEQKSQFETFNFTFGSANALTATDGTNVINGTWSVTSDNSDDHHSGLDFNIAFAAPGNFAELTEDWEILQRTDTKLRLRHVSGGNGGTDYLTFEKNANSN